jgi:hypothetical protein
VLLKSDENNGYFTRRLMHIYDKISLNSSMNEKRFGTKVVRKITTCLLYSITFIRKRAVHEVMWKNIVDQTGYN